VCKNWILYFKEMNARVWMHEVILNAQGLDVSLSSLDLDSRLKF
jgi:hypothetical protein